MLQLLLHHAIIRITVMNIQLPAVYEHRPAGGGAKDMDMGEILSVSPFMHSERMVTLKLIKHAGVVAPAEDVSPTAGTRIR